MDEKDSDKLDVKELEEVAGGDQDIIIGKAERVKITRIYEGEYDPNEDKKK